MQNDFHIVFQPILDTSTECLIGAECLMRWSMGGKRYHLLYVSRLLEVLGK